MRRLLVLFVCAIVPVVLAAQHFDEPFPEDPDHPAIAYTAGSPNNVVSQLNIDVQLGQVQLEYDEGKGYLSSLLAALKIPMESQMLVFSKTSFQATRISPDNPRAIYFNDSVSVGWVRGGPVMEIAVHDPHQGVIFYTLDQRPLGIPKITRNNSCLGCHVSYASLTVPGMLVRSVFPAPNGSPINPLGNYISDDHSPFEERWGGWYVTGRHGSMRHMGNAVVLNADDPESMITDGTLNLDSLKDKFDTDAYLSPYSDIVALMVFEHQMHLTNLLTRLGWEVRVALYQQQLPESNKDPSRLDALLADAAKEFVDSLLFINEAPLTSRIHGTSGFAEKFESEGPYDSKHRSLREFDLEHRLMRYPCSYMIYSEAFEALPAEGKRAVYTRLWQVLSGSEQDHKYARLSGADRQAIVEILHDTKKGLPAYFTEVTE